MVSVTSSGVNVASELPVTMMVRSLASTRVSRLEQEDRVTRQTDKSNKVVFMRGNFWKKYNKSELRMSEVVIKDVKSFRNMTNSS
jgi:hypothetical protein